MIINNNDFIGFLYYKEIKKIYPQRTCRLIVNTFACCTSISSESNIDNFKILNLKLFLSTNYNYSIFIN